MPAPGAAAAAAPLLAPVLGAGADIAKSVVAQLSIALQQPLWKRELMRPKRGGFETTSASMPAWLVVGGLLGGAATLWILGLGVGVHEHRVVLTERPRLTLPFAPGTAGYGFIPDWVPLLGGL